MKELYYIFRREYIYYQVYSSVLLVRLIEGAKTCNKNFVFSGNRVKFSKTVGIDLYELISKIVC